MITVKRVYEKVENSDGYRILIDRLWPRGLSREKAKIDLWLKGIAPSTELRKWFSHAPDKWADFKEQYRKELQEKPELVLQIRKTVEKRQTVTLLYAAKDTEHNNAVVLKEYLSV